MGAEQSSEAAVDDKTPMSPEDAAATKVQAAIRGRTARLKNPLSRPDYKGGDGSVTMRVKVMAKKKGFALTSRSRKMGIELDEDNCIVSLMPPAKSSELAIGDFVLDVDGHELGTNLLVRRQAPETPPQTPTPRRNPVLLQPLRLTRFRIALRVCAGLGARGEQPHRKTGAPAAHKAAGTRQGMSHNLPSVGARPLGSSGARADHKNRLLCPCPRLP